MNVFISGISSGLGLGLCEHYLKRDQVFGISRRAVEGQARLKHQVCDLGQLENIDADLDQLFQGLEHLDLAILNAGQLGNIETLKKQSLTELKHMMDVNLWANKVICDFLLERFPQLQQVVLISSGASINGHKGWGGYSLSKAALNMLAKLYASEHPNTHFSALAPGLIDSAMQDQLCGHVDPETFPSVLRLKEARGTQSMPTPSEAGETIATALAQLLKLDSGAYADIRTL